MSRVRIPSPAFCNMKITDQNISKVIEKAPSFSLKMSILLGLTDRGILGRKSRSSKGASRLMRADVFGVGQYESHVGRFDPKLAIVKSDEFGDMTFVEWLNLIASILIVTKFEINQNPEQKHFRHLLNTAPHMHIAALEAFHPLSRNKHSKRNRPFLSTYGFIKDNDPEFMDDLPTQANLSGDIVEAKLLEFYNSLPYIDIDYDDLDDIRRGKAPNDQVIDINDLDKLKTMGLPKRSVDLAIKIAKATAKSEFMYRGRNARYIDLRDILKIPVVVDASSLPKDTETRKGISVTEKAYAIDQWDIILESREGRSSLTMRITALAGLCRNNPGLSDTCIKASEAMSDIEKLYKESEIAQDDRHQIEFHHFVPVKCLRNIDIPRDTWNSAEILMPLESGLHKMFGTKMPSDAIHILLNMSTAVPLSLAKNLKATRRFFEHYQDVSRYPSVNQSALSEMIDDIDLAIYTVNGSIQERKAKKAKKAKKHGQISVR